MDKSRRGFLMGAAATALVATTPLEAQAYEGPVLHSLIGTDIQYRGAHARAAGDSVNSRNSLVVSVSSQFAQGGDVREAARVFRNLAMDLKHERGIEIASIIFAENPGQTEHFKVFPYHNGILPVPYRDGIDFDKAAIVASIERSQSLVMNDPEDNLSNAIG